MQPFQKEKSSHAPPKHPTEQKQPRLKITPNSEKQPKCENTKAPKFPKQKHQVQKTKNSKSFRYWHVRAYDRPGSGAGGPGSGVQGAGCRGARGVQWGWLLGQWTGAKGLPRPWRGVGSVFDSLGQKTESLGQKTEGRGQETEDWGQVVRGVPGGCLTEGSAHE